MFFSRFNQKKEETDKINVKNSKNSITNTYQHLPTNQQNDQHSIYIYYLFKNYIYILNKQLFIYCLLSLY